MPEAPHLSTSAQPAAASLPQRAGRARDAAAPHLPPHQLLWTDPTSCSEVPLVHRSLCVCPQGGGHDLHISQTAQKISIKTGIIGGSGHGAEGEGRNRVEIFVCQGEQWQKVLVTKNVLSVWFVSWCCSPRHRAAVQLSLAQKFDEEACASCRSSDAVVWLWMQAKMQQPSRAHTWGCRSEGVVLEG